MQDMNSLIEKYVNEPVWAVVGASNSRAKYGNRIYLKLREAGYTVYPVNRRERLIEGDTAYSQSGRPARTANGHQHGRTPG